MQLCGVGGEQLSVAFCLSQMA